jgi:uncharacterized protein Yka (UPF0111/DUF47 family)
MPGNMSIISKAGRNASKLIKTMQPKMDLLPLTETDVTEFLQKISDILDNAASIAPKLSDDEKFYSILKAFVDAVRADTETVKEITSLFKTVQGNNTWQWRSKLQINKKLD